MAFGPGPLGCPCGPAGLGASSPRAPPPRPAPPPPPPAARCPARMSRASSTVDCFVLPAGLQEELSSLIRGTLAEAAAQLAALVRADLRSELAAVLDAQGGAARLQGSPRPACVRARPLDGHDSAPDFQAHQPKGPARFADELSDGASDASPTRSRSPSPRAAGRPRGASLPGTPARLRLGAGPAARARAAAGKGAAGAAPAALADLAHVPPGELASLSSRSTAPARTASGWLSGLQRRSEQPLVGSTEGPSFRVSFVHAFSRAKSLASIGLTPIAEERRLRAAAVLLRLFDSSACAVLLLNLVFIGAETEYNARGGGSEQGEVAFQAAEVCFLAFFLTDLLRRYCQDRKDFFRGGMWRWNVFEAALVTVQFLDVMVQFSLGTSKEREQTRSTGRMVISLMRFLRLARVLRVLRLFQFLQELNKLIWLIYASLRAFIWTVVLLVTMTYMFGVFLTQLVVDCTSDNPEWNGEFGDELSTYYSSVGSSVLYLFAATSGGIDWSSLLVPLKGVAEEAAGVVVLLFLLYITFTVMVVMNLVTGVFVEGAKRLNETERESLLCRRMKEIFEIATPQRDCAGDEVISLAQFHSQLGSPYMTELLDIFDIDRPQAESLFTLLDRDGTSTLTAEEFVRGALRLRAPARAFDVAALQREGRLNASSLSARVDGVEAHVRRLVAAVGPEPGAHAARCPDLRSERSPAGWASTPADSPSFRAS